MRLSAKAIVSIVAGSSIVTGGAVAVPLAVTLVAKNAQEVNAAAAEVTLQVPYQAELVPPPSREGYLPPVLVETNYRAGMPVITKALTAAYRFIPDNSNPSLQSLYISYRVIIVKAFVKPTQLSVSKTYTYRSPSSQIEKINESDLPSRDGTGYLAWDFKNPSWWRQTPSVQKIELNQVEGLEVGNRFYALYSSKVDEANYTGNSDTYRVYYSVVRGIAEPVIITDLKGEVKYGETVLPGADVTLPKLNIGYGPWQGPVYTTSNGQPFTSEDLAKTNAGLTFKATWTAPLDRKLYGGSDSVYEITYTIKPQSAPVPIPSVVEDRTTVIYGQNTLPKIPVGLLPATPRVGWLYWIEDPEYFSGRNGNTPFTAAQLATSPAGTVFRAVYTNRPDPNFESVAYTHTVIYTVARAKVNPDIHADALDDTSIVERQNTFPVYATLPPISFGYGAWGTPRFETESGTLIDTATKLSALSAGTVVYAVYTSQADSNHEGADAIFRVKYTIASRNP